MPVRRLRLRSWFWAWGVLLLLPASCRPAELSTPASAAAPASPPTAAETRPGWDLIWQDEFEGAAIDPARWSFETGGNGWGNNEWEFYTDRPENARLEDGTLVIEARAEEFLHRHYTSARLITRYSLVFTYGRVEARMQLPFGKGIWPAFWLLGADIESSGWPACGEIDIMEHIGREPTRIYGTVHGPGYSGASGVGDSAEFPAGTLSDSFHVYAVEWEPEAIRWYVDEVEFFRVDPGSVPGDWVFDHPFFLILNLAVGGNWPGYPDETTVFPQFLRVDYVRVYQRPGQAEASPGAPGVMHLGNITLAVRDSSDGTRQAAASITVVDGDGLPVEGAYVSGGWVGAVTRGETKGRTDSSGTVQLLSDPITRAGEVTFCVIGVTRNGFTYDESANEHSCGKVVA